MKLIYTSSSVRTYSAIDEATAIEFANLFGGTVWPPDCLYPEIISDPWLVHIKTEKA